MTKKAFIFLLGFVIVTTLFVVFAPVFKTTQVEASGGLMTCGRLCQVYDGNGQNYGSQSTCIEWTTVCWAGNLPPDLYF